MPRGYFPPMLKVCGYDMPSQDRLRELMEASATAPEIICVMMTAKELAVLVLSASCLRAGGFAQFSLEPEAPEPRRYLAIDEMIQAMNTKGNEDAQGV